MYLENIATHDITFGIGPAGTGKTYLAVACAVDALERSAVQRIVLTRPAVEAGERLGFLPGDLAQKVDPYLRPLYDALYDLMGFDKVTKAFERSALEIAPLAFMRGRTLNNAFVILDEAQNTTPEQMKMFLTRIGFGAKAVVTGDVSQIDLPKTQLSGLIDAERVLKRVKGIAITPLHQRRRGAPSAGGAHRRRLRRARRTAATRKTAHSYCLIASSAVRRWQCRMRSTMRLNTLTCRCSSASCPTPRRTAPPCRATRSRAGFAMRWHADAEITVRIVGADEGQALNRDYRSKDYATNVLTFDYTREPRGHGRPGAVRAGGRARGARAAQDAAGALRAPAGARHAARAGLGPRDQRGRCLEMEALEIRDSGRAGLPQPVLNRLG